MPGTGALPGFHPDTQQRVRSHGAGQSPGELRGSFMSPPGVQAGRGVDDVGREAARPAVQRERRGSSADYLGYLLCAAGRPDLLTTRHLRGRFPPEMRPMC
jgi:hypothetical protein